MPAPSITVAPAGIATVAPTATIFPSAMETIPFRMVGPAAVMTLTFRITRGGAAMRAYVLGNGSAFGRDTPPGPVEVTESRAVAGACVELDRVGAHAQMAAVAMAGKR